MSKIDTSVIISTFNSPDWLEKVLHGFNNQTFKDFEVVIADDGSDKKTEKLINEIQKILFYPVKHVWHPDNGFQKTKILNQAILQSDAEYIIMTDGDCIPRNDFVAQHVKYRRSGYFLSGGYFKLPMSISKSITIDDIYSERCFNLKWLKNNKLSKKIKNLKLLAKGNFAQFLNFITPTSATWNGHNASGWKKDILAVNGFDERMAYGGEDRELGERLMNYGIKGKQIRYQAICVHLDHERGYVNNEALELNAGIRRNIKMNKVVWSAYGIIKK